MLKDGAGDDFLRGGTLADTFIYNSGGGADIIDDFLMSDGDTLILDSALWGDAETAADLLASYGSIGGDGLYALNFGGGDRITCTVQIDAPDLADHLFMGDARVGVTNLYLRTLSQKGWRVLLGEVAEGTTSLFARTGIASPSAARFGVP